ncbi:hypothetical protein [Acetivibrio cellulolyticus]|uniref:hypothetical protein n=1 Tax=Acetivibrio cellulolyticus TaxID=35830 RepID=UPI0001E2F67A|nr:hypothetical protein [Acetivibrio cellulolyticus]
MSEGYLIMFLSFLISLLANMGLLFGGTIGNIMTAISTIFTVLISIYVLGGIWEKRLWDS